MADLISLDMLKMHLRLDGTDEDALLKHYLEASVKQVELITHRKLVGDICTGPEDLPADIKQWLMLTVGDMYKTRENEQEKSYTTYFKHLLDGYIDYSQEEAKE